MKPSAIAKSIFDAADRLDQYSSGLIARPTLLSGMGDVFEDDVRRSAAERRANPDDFIGNYFNDGADGLGAAVGGIFALPIALAQLTYRYGLKGVAKTAKLAAGPFVPPAERVRAVYHGYSLFRRNDRMPDAWRTRCEDIAALADPAEKVLLLQSLQADLNREVHRQPDVDGKICLTAMCGGVAAFFIGMATCLPMLCAAGAVMFMSSLPLAAVDCILPSTRKMKRAEEDIARRIDGILAAESVENFAASPHLERAIQAFPVLHQRFADASRANAYRRQALPEKPRPKTRAARTTKRDIPPKGFSL